VRWEGSRVSVFEFLRLTSYVRVGVDGVRSLKSIKPM